MCVRRTDLGHVAFFSSLLYLRFVVVVVVIDGQSAMIPVGVMEAWVVPATRVRVEGRKERERDASSSSSASGWSSAAEAAAVAEARAETEK